MEGPGDINHNTHTLRHFTEQEIAQLECNGNRYVPDRTDTRAGRKWKGVWLVEENVDPTSDGSAATVTATTLARIHNCVFCGTCVVSQLAGAAHYVDDVPFPPGLYDSTIANSVLHGNVLVSRTTLVSQCVVGERAAIVSCGNICMVSASGAEGRNKDTTERSPSNGKFCCSFANGQVIPVVVETGERSVAVFAEMTLEQAAKIAGNRRAIVQDAWNSKVKHYVSTVATNNRTVIGKFAQLLNCPRVQNAFVGSGAYIAASTIIHATILSEPVEASRTIIDQGCVVEDSIVQWGCHCSTMAVVSGSFMCATSSADRHAKLINTILGPSSGVSEGEMTSCLVG